MKTPHKHAALIKAWADGAEIETRPYSDARWFLLEEPHWHLDREYRVKPETKPDAIDYVFVGAHHLISVSQLEWARETNSNLKLTFDGETGKLKAAEVIA